MRCHIRSHPVRDLGLRSQRVWNRLEGVNRPATQVTSQTNKKVRHFEGLQLTKQRMLTHATCVPHTAGSCKQATALCHACACGCNWQYRSRVQTSRSAIVGLLVVVLSAYCHWNQSSSFPSTTPRAIATSS